jgi:magnesium transporter
VNELDAALATPSPTPSDIEKALQAREFGSVRRALAEQLPADVAELIEGLDEAQRAVLFRLLPRDLEADVFEYLAPEAQEALLRALGREEVAAILNEMSPDDRTALLEELPAAVTRQLLALLTPEERQVARQLLGYPEDSIGRLMTPEVIAVGPDWTVRRALDHIRSEGRDSETLNVIYVVDERGKLVDDLRIRQLLLAGPDVRIVDLTDGQFVALRATDDQETAVRIFAEYDRVAFPVTDSRGMLLGIVTVDDVLDVAEEEATEDIQKIGGMAALEQPYMQVSYAQMLRKRAGWLVLLFLGQLLTLNAMQVFSARMEQVLVLALFVPLIISSGGNCGSQAATLVIRALALEEVTLRDWWRVMRREVLFGLTMGAVLAAIGFVRILVGRQLGEDYGRDWALVGVVVGLALVGVVLWGLTIGSMLPFALRRLGLDPATSSTPFVATLVDVTGLFIYFVAATAVLF